MKNIKYLILLILLIIPFNVKAEGGYSVSSSNVSIYVGDSVNITVSANNAAGRVDYSSVNSSIASINKSNCFLDKDSDTFTISANSIGTTTISITPSSFATYKEEIITNVTYITVNVLSRPVNKPNTNITNNKNNDTSLSSLSIDGYNLIQIDENNYTLNVNPNIKNINVTATTSNNKSKVIGVGNYNLNKGSNKIELVVTAESGSTRIYTITVNRKYGYDLNDLENKLKDKNIKTINILLTNDLIIDNKYIKLIEKSNKTVYFDYYDSSMKLIYSWILTGKESNSTGNLVTNINFNSENREDILKLSNYPDCYILHVSNNEIDGTKLKIYVGDKYKDGSYLNIYSYLKIDNKLGIIDKNIKVKDGFVTFRYTSSDDLLITKSEVIGLDNALINTTSSINTKTYIVFGIVFIFMFIIIIFLLFLLNKDKINNIISNHKNNKEKDVDETVSKEVKVLDEVQVQVENKDQNINNNCSLNDNVIINK